MNYKILVAALAVPVGAIGGLILLVHVRPPLVAFEILTCLRAFRWGSLQSVRLVLSGSGDTGVVSAVLARHAYGYAKRRRRESVGWGDEMGLPAQTQIQVHFHSRRKPAGQDFFRSRNVPRRGDVVMVISQTE